MPSDPNRESNSGTDRWAGEGGADPQGPATDVPADRTSATAEKTTDRSSLDLPQAEPAPQDVGEAG